MPYKSKFTGSKVDALLQKVQDWEANPATLYDNLTGEIIIGKLTGEQIMSKLTGQMLIDKINTVPGNIVFNKFVNCTANAGKEIS